ncbi:MAG: hypothetical protein JO316_00135 [Abitibacteriaceae bacterium]|nr:hypothetical protein [Abditibacteriaceae bacterium]
MQQSKSYFKPFFASFLLLGLALAVSLPVRAATELPNDNFSDAQVINGAAGSVVGSFASATAESDEPANLNRGHSVWYRWTAPTRGSASFNLNLNGDFLAPEVAVYTGASLSTLVPVATGDDDAPGGAGVNFATRANNIYYIAADVQQTDELGQFTLAWTSVADTTAPIFTFTAPLNKSARTNLNAILGIASDDPNGSGIDHVDVLYRRSSDGKYWTGRTWSVTATRLHLAYNEFNADWENDFSIPYNRDLPDGTYTLQALAYDVSGNQGSALTSFVIDRVAPTVAFTAPLNNVTASTFPAIIGTAVDTSNGSGLDRVELLIVRLSDGKYWTGTSWTTVSTILTTTLGGRVWTRRTGLPTGANLLSGKYLLIARAFDHAQNGSRVQETITINKPVGHSVLEAKNSSVQISQATASAATNDVRLTFTAPLDAEAAADASHYIVEINNCVVMVESAGYDASLHSVTLALPGGSLHVGDKVAVQWSGLSDVTGKESNGYSGALTAR